MTNIPSISHHFGDLVGLKDGPTRIQTLTECMATAEGKQMATTPPKELVNLHVHTCFSYNPQNYSPALYACLAKKAGLEVAGIVDFDVLDGLEEFITACRLVNLKYCVGIESRVFVPEFSTRVINSPGEPGVAYHMGAGMTTTRLPAAAQAFLDQMRATAVERNRELVARVNAFLQPVALDVEADVLPLTPRGNATERHICLAYARKAAALFPDEAKLAAFWREKIAAKDADLDLPDGPKLQGAIRSKLMKRGGVGYVQPGEGSFPRMADMNRFVMAAGGIPTLTWLDGLSDGEQGIEELMDVAMASGGAAAINIIPDRNFTPGVRDQKLGNLQHVVKLAEQRGLPILVGTEMNSPGLKFVDDFAAAELKPLVPAFLRGARIIYAHTVLQRAAGLGYLSDWSRGRFADARARNIFYAEFGRMCTPRNEDGLAGLTADTAPEQIIAILRRT